MAKAPTVDVFKDLADKLRRSALRPSIVAYQPLPHQIEFHTSTAKQKLFIGGNRAGKTVAGATEALYWLTGKHPYRDTPRPPVAGRAIAVDFLNGVEKIIKPEIMRWIPPSELIEGSWEKSYSKELKTLTLANGSTLEFMSLDQDLDKFAGTSRDFCWLDEEPDYPIYLENRLRLLDKKGSLWITMTPVEGMCFDVETEVLTSRGFKKYYELEPNEILLTHNVKHNVNEWQALQGLYINPDFSGIMHRFSTLNAFVTQNHKWVVKKSLKKSYDLTLSDRLTIAAPYSSPVSLNISLDMMYLIGFLVGDGTLFTQGKSRCVIYQNVGKKYDKLCDKLDSCGLHWTAYSMRKECMQIHFYSDLIRMYLYSDKTPRGNWISQLSSEQAESFIEGVTDADGRTLPSGAIEITQNRGKLTDFISSIAVLTGRRVTITDNGINTKSVKIRLFTNGDRYNYSQCTSSHTTETYSGLVWCPSVPNGTIIAKRGKDIYITGNTWVYDELYLKARIDPNILVVEVNTDDNTYLSMVEIEELFSSMSDEDRQARQHGKFVQIGGLIYKNFNPSTHILPDIKGTDRWDVMRTKWMHFAMMDHGFNNPTCWLWGCVNSEGVIVIYDEHYASGMVVKDHAEVVRERELRLGCDIVYRVGDPSIRNTDPLTGTSVHQEYAEHGVPIVLGNNDVRAGINRVITKLNGIKGKPQLFVTNNCEHLIYEMGRYRWKKWEHKKANYENNKREEPHKKDDHACDALRYGVASRPEVEDGTVIAPSRDMANSYPPVGNLYDHDRSFDQSTYSDPHLGEDF